MEPMDVEVDGLYRTPDYPQLGRRWADRSKMMYFLIAIVGIVASYVGINGLVQGFKTDALYEDARKNRIRVLNQTGDGL